MMVPGMPLHEWRRMTPGEMERLREAREAARLIAARRTQWALWRYQLWFERHRLTWWKFRHPRKAWWMLHVGNTATEEYEATLQEYSAYDPPLFWEPWMNGFFRAQNYIHSYAQRYPMVDPDTVFPWVEIRGKVIHRIGMQMRRRDGLITLCDQCLRENGSNFSDPLLKHQELHDLPHCLNCQRMYRIRRLELLDRMLIRGQPYIPPDTMLVTGLGRCAIWPGKHPKC